MTSSTGKGGALFGAHLALGLAWMAGADLAGETPPPRAPEEVAPARAVLPIGELPKGPVLPSQTQAVALDDGAIVQFQAGARETTGSWTSLVRRTALGVVDAGPSPPVLVRVATLATDGERVAMAWQGTRADGLQAIFLQLFDGSLAPISEVIQVSGVSEAHRYVPALAVNQNQVLVAFEAAPPVSQRWQRTSLFARRFDWVARPIASAFRVDQPPVDDVERGVNDIHALLSDRDEAVLAWLDWTGGESSLGDVRRATFDLSGDEARPTSGERTLGIESEQDLREAPHGLIGLKGGGYVVLWETSALWPRGQVFNSDHSPRTEPFPLLQTSESVAPFERALLTLDGVALADGGFVASWTGTCRDSIFVTCPDPALEPLEDYFDGSDPGVFVRSFDAWGQPLGPSRLMHPRAEGGQTGFLVPSARHLRGGGINLASVPAIYREWLNRGFLRPLAPACSSDADTACTGTDARFRIEVLWHDFTGGSGRALVQQEEAAWASFSFFDPGQIDVVVKVIDARSLSGNHWVFYASLSDVSFDLSVVDTQTGLSRVYRNPAGLLASRGDTVGLPQLDPVQSDVLHREPRRRPPQSRGSSPGAPRGAVTECAPSTTRLCFFDRFAAEVRWRDFASQEGVGRELELRGDTQAFWFFAPSNPELFVKMIDGRAVNGSYWLFFGSLSNVEFELEVTDLQTGAVRRYANPSGEFASVSDIDAFPDGESSGRVPPGL